MMNLAVICYMWNVKDSADIITLGYERLSYCFTPKEAETSHPTALTTLPLHRILCGFKQPQVNFAPIV